MKTNRLKSTKIPLGIVSGVAAINLLQAVVAFIKDVAVAAYMGTTSQADAYLLAFFIPDTVGNNLIGAAIGVACVPVFSVLSARGEARRFNRGVLHIVSIFGLFTGTLLLMFYWWRNPIVNFLGNGFSMQTAALCTQLFMVLLPAMLILVIANIGISTLQVIGRFKTASFALVLYNLIALGGVAYAGFTRQDRMTGVFTLSYAVLAGFIIEALYLIFHLQKEGVGLFRRKGLKALLIWNQEDRMDIKNIFNVFIPYFVILLSSQVIYSVERFLASGLGTGTVSGLNYAFRLAQFPIWVFIAAISVVVLPSMSKAAGLKQLAAFEHTLQKAAELVLIIALPLTLSFFILREPLISALLMRGAFTMDSVKLTSDIMAGYALSIVFQGISLICLRAYMAIQRMGEPMLLFVASAVINIVVDLLLVPQIGPAGLGWGAFTGALFNMVFMLFSLVKRIKATEIIHTSKFIKILAANTLLTAVLILFKSIWSAYYHTGILEHALTFGILSGVCCALVYILGLRVCKVI